ncbi:MAG: aldo/keto reductase [Chlorobi bacterium]|nr:aldo/keto reductase [Chlorobiota bacterium]
MSLTEEYAERFPAMPFTRWLNGIVASPIGIGTYRMNLHEPEHIAALKSAFTSGINVVDTATNYSDGNAEELIGHALRQVAAEGFERGNFVVISKAGYVQGRNLNRAIKREHQGHAFPHMVKYDDALWHCIHPEFLQDQLDRSLRHLQTPYVDAYLLHNPEYFLLDAVRKQIPLDEARAEFYYRIELAFRYLENEARARRISWYGVSSNSFGLPAHDERFVSLEQLWNIATDVAGDGHHFRVVQAPLNLLEPGIAAEPNCSGQTFLQCAQSYGMVVMVNRVLNAIVQNTLVRLVIHAASSEPAPSGSDIAARLADVMQREDHFTTELLPTLPFDDESKELLADFLSPAAQLATLWDHFDNIEQWHEAETQYFMPRIREAIEAIMRHPTDEVRLWIEEYRTAIEQLFGMLTRYYAHRALPRLAAIEERTKQALGAPFTNLSITELAISVPVATRGVTCTLIGARRRSYVESARTVVQRTLPLLDRQQWESLLSLDRVTGWAQHL